MNDLKEMKIKLANLVFAARQLDEQSIKAWEEIQKLQIEIWPIETGFAIGEIVEARDGSKWVKGKIMDVKLKWGDPMPTIHRFNTGGQLSKRTIRPWDTKDIRKIETDKK